MNPNLTVGYLALKKGIVYQSLAGASIKRVRGLPWR